MKPPCYSVTSASLPVRSDNNLEDEIIGEKLENSDLSQGDFVSSTEQRQVAPDPEAPQSEPITWLKISQPVQGWVDQRQLESAECQP